MKNKKYGIYKAIYQSLTSKDRQFNWEEFNEVVKSAESKQQKQHLCRFVQKTNALFQRFFEPRFTKGNCSLRLEEDQYVELFTEIYTWRKSNKRFQVLRTESASWVAHKKLDDINNYVLLNPASDTACVWNATQPLFPYPGPIWSKRCKLHRAGRATKCNTPESVMYSSRGRAGNLNYKSSSLFNASIVCRHMALKVAVFKFKNYQRIFETKETMEDCIDFKLLSKNEQYKKVAGMNDKTIVSRGQFGQYIKDQFALNTNGKNETSGVLISWNHAIAWQCKTKKSEEGATVYLVKIYDPNTSRRHQIVRSTCLDRIGKLRLSDFLTDKLLTCYCLNQDHSPMVMGQLENDVGVVLEMGERRAQPDGIKVESRYLDRDGVFNHLGLLLIHNDSQHIKQFFEQCAKYQFHHKSSREKFADPIRRCMKFSIEKCGNHEAVQSYIETVLHCKVLSDEQKLFFLSSVEKEGCILNLEYNEGTSVLSRLIDEKPRSALQLIYIILTSNDKGKYNVLKRLIHEKPEIAQRCMLTMLSSEYNGKYHLFGRYFQSVIALKKYRLLSHSHGDNHSVMERLFIVDRYLALAYLKRLQVENPDTGAQCASILISFIKIIQGSTLSQCNKDSLRQSALDSIYEAHKGLSLFTPARCLSFTNPKGSVSCTAPARSYSNL